LRLAPMAISCMCLGTGFFVFRKKFRFFFVFRKKI
jgi:hypothetical protein